MIAVEPEVLELGSEVVPGYRVLAHLSRGRLLDVYDVWSDERDCRCIAKVLRPDRAHDAKGRRRLVNEGRILLELTHPHIVRAYELRRRPQPVLIMETLNGMTLEFLLARQGRLRVLELAHLGRHLCSALAYVHGAGYLHLDLKPGNVVSSLGLARVIDFSLARPPGRGHRGAGTRDYLAPEQARGAYVDAATDVWGLGIVLWESAAGRRLFVRPDAESCDYVQLEGRAPSIRTVRRLPRPLADTIDACLEPDRTNRPPLREVAIVLESLLA